MEACNHFYELWRPSG